MNRTDKQHGVTLTVERGLEVLHASRAARAPLSNAELVRRTGLPKATVSRQVEEVLPNLPGNPDNINPASDGNFWLALVGIRSPALDLAYRMPGFRRRMTQRLPVDEWLIPQINNGCVLKFNLKGEMLETLWDDGAVNHPAISSMREHKGWLYLG